MDTQWLAVIVAIVFLILLVCCFCCCYCYCKSQPGRKSKYSPVRQNSDFRLEQGLQHSDSSDRDDDSISLSSSSRLQSCVEVNGPLSDIVNLQTFVNGVITPHFKGQRLSGYQFAVVLLLSDSDYNNIANVCFDPSDGYGQPLLDKTYPLMPKSASSYGNYIVARPRDNCNHSEEEIFGKYSNSRSPFSQLWNAYANRNRYHAIPSCVLLYSWNLPCSRCTDVIIRAFEESLYHQTKVIVAHTTFWPSETEDEYKANQERMTRKGIAVQHVRNPTHILPA